MRRPRRVNQAAAVRVRESDLDLVAFNRAQRVEQIIDVEADLDFLVLVVHFDLVLGFLLLGVVRLDDEEPRPRGEPDAAVFRIREDGGALQGQLERLPLGFHGPGGIDGYYSPVLRETAIDQLRSEANVADLGANVISSDRQLDVSVGSEDPLQLEDAFSGDDHLLTRL